MTFNSPANSPANSPVVCPSGSMSWIKGRGTIFFGPLSSSTDASKLAFMDWTDDGIVLSAKKHGETSAIVTLLTPGHGRHLGLVRGACRSCWRAPAREGSRSRRPSCPSPPWSPASTAPPRRGPTGPRPTKAASRLGPTGIWWNSSPVCGRCWIGISRSSVERWPKPGSHGRPVTPPCFPLGFFLHSYRELDHLGSLDLQDPVSLCSATSARSASCNAAIMRPRGLYPAALIDLR